MRLLRVYLEEFRYNTLDKWVLLVRINPLINVVLVVLNLLFHDLFKDLFATQIIYNELLKS